MSFEVEAKMHHLNAYNFANTLELPGASLPGPSPWLYLWTPPGALRRAPELHAVRASASCSRGAFSAV